MNRQIYRSLLRSLIRLHAGNTDNDQDHAAYGEAWQRLSRSRLAHFLANRYQHRFQPDARELLTLTLIDCMRKRHPYFQPPLRPRKMPGEFSPGSVHGPAIIVGTHTGYGSAYAFLSDLGHRVSLLIDAQIEEHNPDPWKVRYPDLELIPNDGLSLARTMGALKKGRLVCCAVDYQDPTRRTYSLVSPAIFELARRTSTPLYFAKNTVADDGTIEIEIDGPIPVTEASRSALAMIDYVNADRLHPKHLQVRTPSGQGALPAESASRSVTPPAATPSAASAPPAQSR